MATRYVDKLENISIFDGSYAVNCPFCETKGHTPDTKHKLGVTFGSKDVYHCYRCGVRGSATGLFETKINRHKHFANVVNRLRHPPKNTKETPQKELIDYDSISLEIMPHHIHARRYLYNKRRLSEADIDKYLIRIGNHRFGLYNNRILIPTIDDYGNCVYVVARDYMDYSDAKYRNPPDTHKMNAVWNLNNLHEDQSVIVTEGVFSGMAADRISPDMVGVSIFGKVISSVQASMISAKHPRRIFLSLDGDVIPETVKKNVSVLSSFHRGPVHVVRLPSDQDPDSLDINIYKKIVMESMTSTLGVILT